MLTRPVEGDLNEPLGISSCMKCHGLPGSTVVRSLWSVQP